MRHKPIELPSRRRIVFVVGAGASFEVHLPLGSGLKKDIASLLDIRYQTFRMSGDDLIDAVFRIRSGQMDSHSSEFNSYLRAAWQIRDAMPQAISIDNFIDGHRGNKLIEEIGKIAIVRSILNAEAKSSLFVDSRNIYNKINFTSIQNTWFNSFFQLLTENCKVDELSQRFSQIAIICFNYDRCIEHYMFYALQNYYGISADRSADILRGLEIYHPYGTVGCLPWMDGSNKISFGGSPTPEQLIKLAMGILTFTEGSNVNESEMANARNILSRSERIAFLGFAFHRINLELLYPAPLKRAPNDMCSIYATGFGISDPDAQSIRSDLVSYAGVNPAWINIAQGVSCAQFFGSYSRSLSFR